MTSVNTRILKDHLSSFLHRAEQGEQILVTRNGKPVAALVAPKDVRSPSEYSVLETMAAKGLIELPETVRGDRFPMPPIKIAGEENLASRMVIEDRR